jgi:hypothetical protein
MKTLQYICLRVPWFLVYECHSYELYSVGSQFLSFFLYFIIRTLKQFFASAFINNCQFLLNGKVVNLFTLNLVTTPE